MLTLGCKLNLADSDSIASRLAGAGFDVTGHLCEADGYVLNTCSVTHVADRKSRRLIRSVRRLAPAAQIVVTGCFPRAAGAEAAAALGADLVVGTSPADHDAVAEHLARRCRRDQPAHRDPDRLPGVLRTRGFVKAQEGCNDVCAFCIVPRTRGSERSRSVAEVTADVTAAAEAGAREVVITGTQLGAWGRDLPETLQPADLVAGILERSEIPRIRFSSLQPQDITPRLLALWRDPRLMPHFHLALQSGSDQVLAAMRRRYTAGEFAAAAGRIAAVVPGAAITTDVIVGFPGESEADFAATLALCTEVGFARIHAFPYSVRSRTAAARLPGQVSPAVKRERMDRILALGEVLADGFGSMFLGTVRPVLWEETAAGPGGAEWAGYTDNYLRVRAPGADLLNRITPARLVAQEGGLIAAEVAA